MLWTVDLQKTQKGKIVQNPWQLELPTNEGLTLANPLEIADFPASHVTGGFSK